jgi:AcrR family transcriptional regulator
MPEERKAGRPAPAPEVIVTQANLGNRKREFVRETIYDAAVELFWTKGFDETTVEEVAQAAGISRASFFRYFASKDDLLAQNVTRYGLALTEGIKASPHSLTPFQVMRTAVLSVARHTVTHPRLRKIIDISQRSAAAMQAHNLHLIRVEQSVAAAFAERASNSSNDGLDPLILASLTVSAMNVAINSWYRGDSKEIAAAVESVFSRLKQIVSAEQEPDSSATNIAGAPVPASRKKKVAKR